MLLGEASRPDIRPEVSEGLRFPHPTEWIAHNGFDHSQHTECDASIGLNPIPQIIAKFVLKHGITHAWGRLCRFTLLRQGRPRAASHQSIAVSRRADGHALRP